MECIPWFDYAQRANPEEDVMKGLFSTWLESEPCGVEFKLCWEAERSWIKAQGRRIDEALMQYETWIIPPSSSCLIDLVEAQCRLRKAWMEFMQSVFVMSYPACLSFPLVLSTKELQRSSRRYLYVKKCALLQQWAAVGVPYEPVRQGPQRGSRPEFVGRLLKKQLSRQLLKQGVCRFLDQIEKSRGDSIKRQKTLYPVDRVMDIMQIENVDTKIAPTDPAALPILASNTLDAKLQAANSAEDSGEEQDNRPRSSYGRVPEQHSYTIGDSAGEQSLDQHSGGSSFGRHAKTEGTNYLVGADMFEGDSMCQEADGNEAYGWLKDMESEDEGSATHDSQTEVTENSPSHEINPHFAGRKRKSMNDESSDDIIAKLAPFIKQQIEEALNCTLLPLVSVLRSREEDEQKHREQMLALEKEKLALKREKLLFKRRRVARSTPVPPRSSFSARSGNIRQLRLRVASPGI
ncbi:hypothetical protein M758_1G061900 [Ceratodon purpureus]|nr:hypothetical protein M758_1G061900 [Ceratodon purpureus]